MSIGDFSRNVALEETLSRGYPQYQAQSSVRDYVMAYSNSTSIMSCTRASAPHAFEGGKRAVACMPSRKAF